MENDDMIDEEDSDIDTEEIKGQLKTMQDALQRHFGHHKDVARLRSEGLHGQKEFVVVTPNLAKATPSETALTLRKELEKERKRRIEEMNENDEDTIMTTKAKTGVHDELLHLFAFHDAKYQTETEKLRHKVEDAKEIMHGELLRRTALKIVEKEVVKERKRKLEEVDKMIKGEAENEVELAETNEKMSKVHLGLKSAFKILTRSKESKKSEIQKKSEDSKERVLQDIRRKSAVSSVKQMSSKEQQQRISEYDEHTRSMMNDSSRDLLVDVQEQLLGLFSKLQKDKQVKQVKQMNSTADNKARMQEELVRTASSRTADREASAERAQRIRETKERRGSVDADKQETMELLLNVQKQLLDTCGHVQSESLKQNVKQVQFLKTRQNVLRDIRKTGERRASLAQDKETMNQGRKLSIIGAIFESKMKK